MSDPQWIEFNANEFVRIRLTDLGRRVWHDRHQGKLDAKVSHDGWLEVQLCTAMTVFGPHLKLFHEQPFGMRMLFKSTEFGRVPL